MYRRDNGYITKYAKHNNGPKIVQIKYYDEKIVGNTPINITPLNAKNKRVILKKSNAWRTDVYYDNNTNKYEIMGLKYSDLCFVNGQYGITSKRYNEIKKAEKVANNSQFVFSLYNNDRIKVVNDKDESIELLFNSRSGNYPGYVTLKPIDRNSFEKGQNIKVYGKISSPFLKPLVKSN